MILDDAGVWVGVWFVGGFGEVAVMVWLSVPAFRKAFRGSLLDSIFEFAFFVLDSN